MRPLKNKMLHILILIAACLILSACATGPEPTGIDEATRDVDPVFREYYLDLGGVDTLGAPISPPFADGDNTCQFTVNALMCFNPYDTSTDRFFLYPLGSALNIVESPANALSEEDPNRLYGYEIYPDFLDKYHELNGSINVGRPLTGIRYDEELQRIEQYFENLGFYASLQNGQSEVRLLPYGAYICDRHCRSTEYVAFAPHREKPNMPFLASLNRLGGVETFGAPLTDDYLASDGHVEQVFENAVLYAPADDLSQVRLRPLPRLLGMVSAPPGPQRWGQENNVIFINPPDDPNGYHVPVLFDQFIAQHGGYELSGQPIADTTYYEDNLPRQCYETYCLDFHEGAEESRQVRMAPLGSQYLKQFGAGQTPVMPAPAEETPPDASPQAPPAPAEDSAPPPAPVTGPQEPETAPQAAETAQEQPAPTIPPEPTPSPEMAGDLILRVAEQRQEVAPDQSQILYILVHRALNLEPVPGIVARITLVTPLGESVYYTPSTGSGGRTSLAIPPMPDVENGSLVSCQVCLELDIEPAVCVYESYLIWGGP